MKALGKCLEHLGTILQRARWLHKVWKVPEAAGLSGRKDEAAGGTRECAAGHKPWCNCAAAEPIRCGVWKCGSNGCWCLLGIEGQAQGIESCGLPL